MLRLDPDFRRIIGMVVFIVAAVAAYNALFGPLEADPPLSIDCYSGGCR